MRRAGIYTCSAHSGCDPKSMQTKDIKILTDYLEPLGNAIFWPGEIAKFLQEIRQKERRFLSISLEELLRIAIQQKLIARMEFQSEHYDLIVRYTIGKHSVQELALSLQRESFLSHGTALGIHGISKLRNTIYVNREQSAKNRPNGVLTQAAITQAFKNKQRQSNF